MEFFTNDFTVTFSNADAANKAKQIADECFRTLHYDLYSKQPSILAADSLVVEENALTFGAICFDSADLMDASRKVIKALSYGMKNETFEFSVIGIDTYAESWVEGAFQNGVLVMTSTYFPEGYSEFLFCPECDEPIVSMEDYDPNAVYVCPECGEELDFSFSAPVIEKEQIAIC